MGEAVADHTPPAAEASCREHEYVASVLGSLLTGQPVEGLGDKFVPTQVAVQQRHSRRSTTW
jgi:hypothetical protein